MADKSKTNGKIETAKPFVPKQLWIWVGGLLAFVIAIILLITINRIVQQGWTKITSTNSGLAGDRIYDIAIDKQGRVWIGTQNKGLSVLETDGDWLTYTPTNSGLANNTVVALAIDEEGRVWAGLSWDGLSVLEINDHWETYSPTTSTLAGENIRALAIGEDTRIWVGTADGLSVIDPDRKGTIYSMANSNLTNDDIRALAIDREGQVWVGTAGGGLNVLSPNGDWSTYTTSNSDLIDDRVIALAIDQQDRIWIGSDKAGLSVLSPNGDWSNYTSANSRLIDDEIRDLATDKQGRVWVGTRYGLSVFNSDGTWTNYTTANSGMVDNWIRALYIDESGQIWLGTLNGLNIFDPDAALSTQISQNLIFVRAAIFLALVLLVIGLIGWTTVWWLKRPVAAPVPVYQPEPTSSEAVRTTSETQSASSGILRQPQKLIVDQRRTQLNVAIDHKAQRQLRLAYVIGSIGSILLCIGFLLGTIGGRLLLVLLRPYRSIIPSFLEFILLAVTRPFYQNTLMSIVFIFSYILLIVALAIVFINKSPNYKTVLKFVMIAYGILILPACWSASLLGLMGDASPSYQLTGSDWLFILGCGTLGIVMGLSLTVSLVFYRKGSYKVASFLLLLPLVNILLLFFSEPRAFLEYWELFIFVPFYQGGFLISIFAVPTFLIALLRNFRQRLEKLESSS